LGRSLWKCTFICIFAHRFWIWHYFSDM